VTPPAPADGERLAKDVAGSFVLSSMLAPGALFEAHVGDDAGLAYDAYRSLVDCWATSLILVGRITLLPLDGTWWIQIEGVPR
jgi:hypothetical protein